MDVVGRLRLDILRKGLDTDILVNNCGTIDLCDCGPNIVVYPDNVIYSGVTVKDLPEIVEHLRGGPVVERLVMAPSTPAESTRHAFYAAAVSAGGGMTPDDGLAIATEHGLDQPWIDEQLRRGFMARKPDPESGEDRLQVTKKARARYGIL
ncbi:MAG TPA: (2Fe-2S) ferredoxin domain-containing protein [Thermomicrobiales bacterium]|nr:(2Fe-2S) ferredoxin domain-containing protein [Thermomicrobiales bacterium]